MGFFRGKEPKKKTIGVFGSDRGVGVTHLALAIANFISLESGEKVILADLSGTKELKQIKTAKGGTLFGVSYFPGVTNAQIPQLMNESYDYLIFDFGSDREKNYKEFLRCDRKIVTGSFSPWKRQSYDDFMQFINNEKSYMEWAYCALFGLKKEDRKDFKKLYGVPVRAVPFFESPYELGKEEYLFLQEFKQGL